MPYGKCATITNSAAVEVLEQRPTGTWFLRLRESQLRHQLRQEQSSYGYDRLAGHEQTAQVGLNDLEYLRVTSGNEQF